jgi:carboxylate-amine ligase
MPQSYSVGIEEEYFLVDARTKATVRAMPEAFLAEAKAAGPDNIGSEFLQSQVEVRTKPCANMAEAGAELRRLRQTVARIAAKHALAILAAGTHPTAVWNVQRQTENERYDIVMDELQMIGQRDLLCGVHVHVELPQSADRVDVMMRMLPFVPLFIALATSSPFWQSRLTGLKGYRLAAYDELPRTGVPELFRNEREYDAYIAALVRAGVIADASYVWWAMRPSFGHPTLELRAPDCCTRIGDAIAIAALYRAIARYLVRNPDVNSGLGPVERALVVENKWRAQRYGVHGTFVDPLRGAISVSDLLDRTIALIAGDAAALGCLGEVEQCRIIPRSGTSADAQLKIYAQANGGDDNGRSALRAVTDWIAEATLR